MSELKAFETGLGRKVYLKSEADKVISELKEKLDLYKRGWEENDKVNAYLYAELRHNKFKRCLDKAAWCESEEKRLEAISPIFDTDKECWEYVSDYWARWRKRWLMLAEQFNPNATAPEENSDG